MALAKWTATILMGMLLAPAYVAGQSTDCDAPELVRNAQTYNAEICRALEAIEQDDLRSAAVALERALSTPLFEHPNFRAFPRLAHVYWQLDETEQARAALRKARLSLGVYTGEHKCVRSGAEYTIQDWTGAALTSPTALEITRRMCGEAYEAVYNARILDWVIDAAELVRLYRDAERLIGPPSAGGS